MGQVPESLPVTEETRERLRAQANQIGEATVLRLCDLLAVAVDDLRQGGDPRLPLELALVKVTRPQADLSRESLAFRVEQLEQGRAQSAVPAPPAPSDTVSQEGTAPGPEPPPASEGPRLELEQLQEAWTRSVVPAVEQRSIPVATVLRDARPAALEADRLTLELPNDWSRRIAEDMKNAELLRDALFEVTGRRLALTFELGEAAEDEADDDDRPLGEEELIAMFKDRLDAREVDGS
jgi:DNA polymerase III gamma/tau subunit